MDYQHNSGIPLSYKRSSSDETNNNTAYATPTHGGQAHLPQDAATSHGLTPPHEHQEWHPEHPQASSLHHQYLHDASIPSQAGHNHPPTPPMREAGYDELQQSLTHQLSRLGRDQIGDLREYTDLAIQPQDGRSPGYPSLHLSDPRGHLQPAPLFSLASQAQQLPPSARKTPGQLSSYPAHVLQPHWQQDAGEDAVAKAQRYIAQQQMMPPGMPFYGAPSPTNGLPQYPAAPPAVQQWPTSSLGQQPYIHHSLGVPRGPLFNATTFSVSHGHGGRTSVDFLHRRASLASQEGVAPGPVPPKKGTKRKKAVRKPEVAATPPPALRHASGQADAHGLDPHLQPGTHEFALHHPHFNVHASQYSYDAVNSYSAYPSAHAPTVGPSHDARLLREMAGMQMEWFSGRAPTQSTLNDMMLNTPVPYHQAAQATAPAQKPPSPKKGPVDWDAMQLSIARDYGDFKYSVYHYEVNPETGYFYAQSWLEDMLSTNLEPGKHKWHTHTSPGFVVKGSRLSVLVLHNAVNPFEWHDTADTTTTIGVYGIEHDCIHWKTIAPGLKWIFDYSSQPTVNTILLKHKYVSTETKAKEKRWHRAYYLAASRQALRGMLNRPEGEIGAEIDPFVISDYDYAYPYEFTAGDVGYSWGSEGGWECSADESESAWEKVRQEMEGWDWGAGECVVTGCSEWE